MVHFFSYIIAFIITVPVFATWLVYFIIAKWNRPKLKAFHQAVNWTTLLYIIAVSILIWLNFHINLTGIIIIFFLSALAIIIFMQRSEEHTSELQSRGHLVCRLLLEKKK